MYTPLPLLPAHVTTLLLGSLLIQLAAWLESNGGEAVLWPCDKDAQETSNGLALLLAAETALAALTEEAALEATRMLWQDARRWRPQGTAACFNCTSGRTRHPVFITHAERCSTLSLSHNPQDVTTRVPLYTPAKDTSLLSFSHPTITYFLLFCTAVIVYDHIYNV